MVKNKAFTLIELLIVVVIIGILAVAVFVAVSGARAKASNANAKNSVSETQKAIEVYLGDFSRNDVGTGAAFHGGVIPSIGAPMTSTLLANLVDSSGKKLLVNVPRDAKGNPILVRILDSGDYQIQAESYNSEAGSKACWVTGSDPAWSNLGNKNAAVGSCFWN